MRCILPKHISQDKEVKLLETMVEIGTSLISTNMPFFISGGADSAHVFDALVPFVPLSDMLGFRVELGTAYTALVVYADELDTSVISNRLEQFMQLAKPLADLGVRLNGRSMGQAYVHVLLVYFDKQKCADTVPILLPQGAKRRVWDKVYLYTGFINVPDQTIVWSEEGGRLGSWRKSMASLFGQTKKALQIFDSNDLQSVLTLAKQ